MQSTGVRLNSKATVCTSLLQPRRIVMEVNSTFQIERQGDVAIVTPLRDLCELEYAHIEESAATALECLEAAHAKNVVLDLAKAEYFGSTALGFFVKLWKRVRSQGGHMALCNVSPNEKKVIHLTRLDTLWTICPSRDEAIQAVSKA